MSGSVVSLIALVPMLFHGIFGCCWHHSHSHASHGHAIATATEPHPQAGNTHTSHSSCHRHDSPLALAEEPHGTHQHPDDSPCEEDRCAYSGPINSAACSQLVQAEPGGYAVFSQDEQQVARQLRMTAWVELLGMSSSHSAHEHCALTQVWLI